MGREARKSVLTMWLQEASPEDGKQIENKDNLYMQTLFKGEKLMEDGYDKFFKSKQAIAQRIMESALKGLKRSDGSTAIAHTERVASAFDGHADPVLKVVALLHDVVEDSYWTTNDLIDSDLPQSIVRSVRAITRDDPAESYLQYLLRLKKDYSALQVKIADMKDNLSQNAKGNLRNKYLLGLFILTGEDFSEDYR